jgi:hypothetical protein
MWWILMKNAHPKFEWKFKIYFENKKSTHLTCWVPYDYMQAHLLDKIQGKMFCSQFAKWKEADCQIGCNNKESHIGLGFRV